jgi:hypothetical protein
VTEPVSPAAARRQRALERQRRHSVESPPARTWWSSHFPFIAAGFVAALLLTITLARYHRATLRESAQASTDPEMPQLDIDVGNAGDSSLTGPHELAAFAAEDDASSAEPTHEAKSVSKSPPLLTAKPKLANRDEEMASQSPQTTAKPVSGEEPASTEQYISTTATETNAPTAEMARESAVAYPATERTDYRPGGRVPREAQRSNYPQTSTPHLR